MSDGSEAERTTLRAWTVILDVVMGVFVVGGFLNLLRWAWTADWVWTHDKLTRILVVGLLLLGAVITWFFGALNVPYVVVVFVMTVVYRLFAWGVPLLDARRHRVLTQAGRYVPWSGPWYLSVYVVYPLYLVMSGGISVRLLQWID